LEKIEALDKNHLYYAALGDFYRKMGDRVRANNAYGTALQFTAVEAERVVVLGKMV
jgi:predicted RNA polymerase sigma factor